MAGKENKGGFPKGMPKSQIKLIITRMKENLPEAYETVRKAISYPRNKENLKKRYSSALKELKKTGTQGKFDTTQYREDIEDLYEKNKINKEEYDSRIDEKELLKVAYQNELSDLKPDDVALTTAKWAIEKTVDMYIKAGNDVKNRLAAKKALEEINKEIGDELDIEEEEDSGGSSNEGNVFSLKMKDE